MEKKAIRGIGLYCGLGVTIEQIKDYLDKAQKAGINALFTSLQLPAMDKDILLHDFPIMCEMAHERGIRVAADIGIYASNLFGIDLHDLKRIKDFGVDILRTDGGYNKDQTIELTNNDLGIEIQLNANEATDSLIDYYVKNGMNKENVHWCHNYYPMSYTGLTIEQVIKRNSAIHRGGFKVAGFIPSQAHRRICVSRGLPTIERHRSMAVSTAIQESYLLGMDYLYFGDDLASEEELAALCNLEPGMVHLRMKPLVDAPEVMEWLDGKEMKQGQPGLTQIVRGMFQWPEYKYKNGFDESLVQPIKKGDVLMAKSTLYRYAGEVQIAKVDLPADEDIGVIGHLNDEDIPILDIYSKDWTPFCIHVEK